MRGYPNYRNEILSRLTRFANDRNQNGTAIFRDLVECWISAGCPSDFEIKRTLHTQKLSSKERWMQLMQTPVGAPVNRA
jgi:hypothetical protein